MRLPNTTVRAWIALTLLLGSSICYGLRWWGLSVRYQNSAAVHAAAFANSSQALERVRTQRPFRYQGSLSGRESVDGVANDVMRWAVSQPGSKDLLVSWDGPALGGDMPGAVTAP